MRDQSDGPEARIQSILAVAEDCIHLFLALLLLVLAVVLAVVVGRDLAAYLTGPLLVRGTVLSFLDATLILFIIAELLHTVRITIRNRRLDAEPFLVVGLIAGVRRVLIVTAAGEKSFQWNHEGIELVILMALILVMTITTWVWRHSTRLRDAADRQPYGGNRPG